MARPYQPKYYPQPKTGTGHIYVHPKTGEKKACKGVAWYIDFKTIDGKRDRKKVRDGHCTCPPRQKGACAHERLAQEALAAVQSSPRAAGGRPCRHRETRCCPSPTAPPPPWENGCCSTDRAYPRSALPAFCSALPITWCMS